MKKVILGAVLAVAAAQSMNALAATGSQTICASPSAAGNGEAVAAGDGHFVKTAFTAKCSANVFLSGYQTLNHYAAGAASSKGKNVFQGSSAGGGVKASTSCAATPCTSTEANTAATSAPSS